ncbi:MAG: hypothetical protein IJY82_07375 [Oscillospiraceae bacterium]|nr:hypothetical protein [Oscillospiraceae bacterium]
MKKAVLCMIAAIILLTGAVSAFEPYESYVYDTNMQIRPGPNGYTPTDIITGVSLGTVALKDPADLFVYDEGEEIYIADTGRARILVTDLNFELKRIITGYQGEEGEVPFQTPKGLFVDSTGIFVADTTASQVIHMDFDGNVITILTKPESTIYQSDVFQPTKVLRDQADNVYVLSTGTFQGIVVFDRNREFSGYVGSVPVALSFEVVTQYFWKQFMNEEQLESMSRYIPVEYANIDIDKNGFVYSVFAPSSAGAQSIYKLSTAGTNIYPMPIIQGDKYSYVSGGLTIRSNFTDICVNDDGYVFAIDNSESRIFMYDAEGNMIFTFGGLGNQIGHIRNPAAIDTIGEKVVALDSTRGAITVFQPTEVCSKIINAIRFYSDGRYSEAVGPWQEVLAYNSNFSLAYKGLGNAMLETYQYEDAMRYYRLAGDKAGYSSAFQQYRLDYVRENYWVLALIVGAVVLVAFAIAKYINALRLVEASEGKVRSGQKYIVASGRWRQMMYIITHPLAGFDDMSWYDMGSIPIAIGIVVLWFATTCLTAEMTGFLFSAGSGEMNILIVLLQTVVLFAAFCASNWIFAVMLDGRATLKNIICATAYCLIPMILTSLIAIPVSHLITADEGVAYTGIILLGQLITGLYIFISQKRIHEISGPTTIALILLTVFGIAFVVFLAVLTYSLFGEVANLISVVIDEILLRF